MGKAQRASGKVRSSEVPLNLHHKGRRYSLLLQRRLRDMLFWPALLIALLAMALVVLSPPGIEGWQPYLVVAGLAGGAAAILSLWFSLRAFARCTAGGLLVSLPFYELLIPYGDIQSTRLSQIGRQYPPENEPWSRRRFLEPLSYVTVVVVELKALPAPRRQLQLWMSRYLLSPDSPGFMLPVRDWLALRAELDEYRSRSYFQ
jgi:hypothetical protein